MEHFHVDIHQRPEPKSIAPPVYQRQDTVEGTRDNRFDSRHSPVLSVPGILPCGCIPDV